MELPERFKKLRTSKDISVYRLSKLSDVSENYIHSIEKGLKQPTVFMMEKLLSFLGSTLSEFFNDSQDVIYPTEFERNLVESVRVLDKEKADAVLHIVKLMK
jgi:transcriptional regulator with XRE-family HTH domain